MVLCRSPWPLSLQYVDVIIMKSNPCHSRFVATVLQWRCNSIKKLFLSFLCLMAIAPLALGQSITDDPYVENNEVSDYSTTHIMRVACSDEYTVFFIEYITSRYVQDGWIALASNTTLSAKNGGNSVRIMEWGIIPTNGNEHSQLDFDERYGVFSDRRYIIYMVFPAIKAGLDNVSIVEHVSNGFAWRGIHINNNKDRGSGLSSSQYGGGWYGKGSSSDGDFTPSGSGTCFALSSDGVLATCYHVVEQASKIRVRGVNGNFNKTYNVKVLMSDRSNDLAILKIDDPSFTSLGSVPYVISDKIADVGDDVFVLGYPLRAVMGDEIKLTNGIVSSRSGFQSDPTSYQLSVAVQPGNSGGPLFSADGSVLGVVNARLAVESASYAVKSPYLRSLIASCNEPVKQNSYSQISSLSLSEKVKKLRGYIYIVEIE